MPAVRKPPVEAVFALHLPRRRGACQWCGGEVTERTEARGWLKFWHDACQLEFQIITLPDVARRVVFDRDHGICADCGEDWSQAARLIPDHYVSQSYAASNPERVTRGPKRDTWVFLSGRADERYVSLREVSLWFVDHHVPLWKVVHLEPLQRIEYFKLANLKTRCDPCHERKSTKESAERAHYRELAGENKEKPKRDWGGRGFQKRAEFTPRPPRQIDKGE